MRKHCEGTIEIKTLMSVFTHCDDVAGRVRGVIHIFGFHWKRPGKAQIFVPPLVPSPSPFGNGACESLSVFIY